MLKRLREDFRKYSWTLWLVIIFFVGGFILPDLFTPGSAGKNDVLVVGKEKITGEDFQKQLSIMLRRVNQQMNNKLNRNFIQQMGIPSQALNTLINSTVIQKVADEYNIRVSDEELAAAIRQSFSQNGRFIGKQQYEEIVRRNQMSISDFEEDFKKDLRTNKLKEVLTSGLSIGEEELFRRYVQENAQAELDYIAVSPDYIETEPGVTDREIEEYYSAHREEFKSLPKRKGDVVLLKYDEFKEQVRPTDREIADYYLAQKAQFREEGTVRVSRIFLKFDAGNREEIGRLADRVKEELETISDLQERRETFAGKAKEISEDENAAEGGDYGTMDWQTFTEQELTTIKKLSTGQVSNVVGTEEGFSILMVTEKTPARTKPLNEVRDMIVDTLSSERVEEEVLARARELHEKALSEGSLRTAAEEVGFPVVSTDYVENRAGIEGLDMTGRIASMLFTLEEQGISDPVPFYLGVAVVQLQDVQEPRQLELAEVSGQITRRIVKEKKIAQLDREVGDIYRRIQRRRDSENLGDYLKSVGLNLESLTYQPGGRLASYTPFPALDRLVFNIDTPLDVFLDPIRMDDDFVFFRIKSRKIVDRSDFTKNRELFYEKKLAELKDNYFASLIMQKREEYEISFNQKLYDEIVEYELQRYK